jgi:hypothetical protein
LARVTAEALVIPGSEFNHGGTRQFGVNVLSAVDIIVFLTQDALLANPDAIAKLLAYLTMRKSARPMDASSASERRTVAARPSFHHPAESQLRHGRSNTLASNGVYITFFRLSAKRTDAGRRIPVILIMNEDTYVAGKRSPAGKSLIAPMPKCSILMTTVFWTNLSVISTSAFSIPIVRGCKNLWRSVRRGLALCDLGNALPDETRPLADSLRSVEDRVEMAGIQAGFPASGIAASDS